MSKADELAAKLKQKQLGRADAEASADKTIELWPAHVNELYLQIEAWLAPLTEAGLNIRRNATRVFESLPSGATFNYAIDQLVLEGNHAHITFDPIARFTANGTGRIDIHAKGQERSLLRTHSEHAEGHWLIHTAPHTEQPQQDPVEFNEDNLLTVIQEGLEL